jgi:hypothetical protein
MNGVAWQSPVEIQATAPAGLPAGYYDVVVTDPRGTSTRLDGGFVSLGPDTEKPTVTLESPTARKLIAAGTTVTIGLTADDHDGFIDSLGATIDWGTRIDLLLCTAAPAPHNAPCARTFVAPTPTGLDATLVITPHAADTAGNHADTVAATFRLAPRPTIASISPTSGPAAGGTEIVVQGADFVLPTVDSEGSRLLLDGVEIEPTSISATEIRAVLPSHDPGIGKISVASGEAESADKLPFEFIAAPSVKLAAPLHGSVTGGIRISFSGNNFRQGYTHIFIGDNEVVPLFYMSSVRMDGIVPAAAAPGVAWIYATDEDLGTRSICPDPFVYEPAAADPPAGGADPASAAGAP